MARQKTASSQFGLTSGIRQTSSDFIMEPRDERGGRSAGRRGRLWVLTEPAAPSGGAGAAAKLVMEAIEEEYFTSPAPSITTALEEAVRAANKLLHGYNSGAPSHKQAYLGVSCVVLHGKDAFIAQVQPARVLVVHQGVPRAFPDGPPRAEVDLTPLGLDPDVDVELSRSPFVPGDTISVISSGLARLVTRAEDEYGLSYQDHRGAVEHLYHSAARTNLMDEHALVIEEQLRSGRRDQTSGSFQSMGREWLEKVRAQGGEPLKSIAARVSLPKLGASTADDQEGTRVGRMGSPGAFVVRARESLTASSGKGGGSAKLRLGATALGVVLLLVLTGGLGLRAYRGHQQAQRFETLMASAQRQRQQARGKPTQAAIQHLQSARRFVSDARRIDPAHGSIRSTLQAIESDLEVVNKVVELPRLSLVNRLSGYDKGTAARLVVVKQRVLLLSRPSGAVRMYDLTSGRGTQLSPRQNVRFTGLSWRAGGAVMLDESGRLHDYDYASGKWSSVKLGGGRPWKQVIGFDTYGSTVYVAAKGAPGVLMYDSERPAQGKLLRSPVRAQVLTPSSLSASTSLWLLNKPDDSLWKVVNGKVTRRLWVDVDPEIEGARGLVALDSNKYLYMLDSRGDRVLQVTQSGQLRAQLRLGAGPGAKGRIDAAYADEDRKKLYVIVNGRLYSAPLKDKPQR